MKGRCLKLFENREKILRSTRIFLEQINGKKEKFKKQTMKVLKESAEYGLDIDTDELKKIQWVVQNKFIPMLKKIVEIEKDMKYLDLSKFDKWDIPDDKVKANEVLRKRVVVSEEIKDKLGDDFKVVKPSQYQSWRTYLSKGRNPQYNPKDVITLIWNYESTDQAKREKEEELRKKYPNKNVYWMNVPRVTWGWIEELNVISKKKKSITEKEIKLVGLLPSLKKKDRH